MIVKYFCPVCERVVDITELEGAAVWHLGHGYDDRIRCASCAAWLSPTEGRSLDHSIYLARIAQSRGVSVDRLVYEEMHARDNAKRIPVTPAEWRQHLAENSDDPMAHS